AGIRRAPVAHRGAQHELGAVPCARELVRCPAIDDVEHEARSDDGQQGRGDDEEHCDEQESSVAPCPAAHDEGAHRGRRLPARAEAGPRCAVPVALRAARALAADRRDLDLAHRSSPARITWAGSVLCSVRETTATTATSKTATSTTSRATWPHGTITATSGTGRDPSGDSETSGATSQPSKAPRLR